MSIFKQGGPLGVCKKIDNRDVLEERIGFIEQDCDNRNGYKNRRECGQHQNAFNNTLDEMPSEFFYQAVADLSIHGIL